MTHTIDVPQQAQIDAESARVLQDACKFCNDSIGTRYIFEWKVCNECYGAARRILRRLVRRELGLN